MKTGVIFLLAATAALFLWGAATQFQRNRDMNRTDQSAYMDYAKKSRTVPFGFVPSRNYMPMYPGVISWFYRDGDSDAEYFQRGKLVNIGIALLSLALLYGVLLRNNDRWDATVAVSAAALSMAVFKAPCFQPEMLFFAISFLMFVAQLHLILRPSLQAAVARLNDEKLLADALKENPRLKALAAEILAAEANIKVARKEKMPECFFQLSSERYRTSFLFTAPASRCPSGGTNWPPNGLLPRRACVVPAHD